MTADEDVKAERRRLGALRAFDPDEARAVFERIARLARRMLAAEVGFVGVLDGRRFWQASWGEPTISPDDHTAAFVELVTQDRDPTWIEDAEAFAWRADAPIAAADGPLNFQAGAPIVLAEGIVIGAVGVFGRHPRPFNEAAAADLTELAAFVADEWERRRTLKALERSEQRLKLATAISDLTVWEMDYRRRELASDGAQSPYSGKTDYDRMAADIWAGVHPNDRPRAQALWDAHINDGAPYRLTHKMMRSDGPHFWADTACEAIRDSQGRIERVIGVMRNIDREKRNEIALAIARDEAEAANRAKSAFLATMSHEIRTPLNGVLGMAQAMAAEALPPAQMERLAVIRQSGEALLAILNDVLDLAKIEAGKLELEAVAFDLGPLLEAVRASFADVAEGKGVGLILDAGDACGVYRGDPNRLRQIVGNLVSNALKFTEEGQVRLAAGWDGEFLSVSVADTGVGVPADRLALLFERFAQADASTNRRFGGTGLGLAICRQLAETMGGAIAAESVVGEGSVFTVRLPLPRLGDAVPSKAPAAPVPAAGAPLKLRVLAAEDNPVNQLVLRTLLGQIGVDPVMVDNGVDALEAWTAQSWDLILMDIQMPVMDGLMATDLIRRREAAEGRRRTPIIALTANAMAHQVSEYRAAGMDAHVSKPIEARALFETLQAVIFADAEACAREADEAVDEAAA
jgi:PAS domain S-box-containing protein